MHKLNALRTLALTLALLALPGCDSSNPSDEPERPPVVEVTAVSHTALEFSTREISSGWTTFRFVNDTHAAHFLIIEKMPIAGGEQKTLEDSKAEVVPVFQNIMDNINGKAPTFPEAGFELPAWYSDVVFMGGPGLTSPQETSETTVNLAPGTYVIECYVKSEEGVFHSAENMIEELTVTESSNTAEPPEAMLQLTVSSGNGITVDGTIDEPGEHTVQLTFADQAAYAHFLGHDVHLVRLSDGANMEDLGAWMNWVVPGGLAEPAPSGSQFLGGAQDMPAGSITYIRANLTPGQYAWIAEVPNPAGKGMLKTFTVE